jgi:hypothetical protein
MSASRRGLGAGLVVALVAISAMVATPSTGATAPVTREAGPPDCTPTFIDVGCGHAFFTDIELLARDGIVGGFPDGGFHPGAPISRQAVAAFFYRLAGEPHPAVPGWPNPGFSDVPSNSAGFGQAIWWFAAMGFTTGYPDGTFRPTAPVTRQALAAWIHRYLGSATETLEPPAFTDWSSTMPFAYDIAWVAAHGLFNGYADGTFRPMASISRQAVAAALNRVLEIRDSCDPLDDRHCFLPFPSDYVMRRTLDTDTGLVVDLDPAVMPENDDGVPIDPTDWEHNDGASPGSTLLAYVPGIDLAQNNFPTIGDQGHYQAEDLSVVVTDLDTGERHPVWVELDMRAESADDRLLMIRPTRNWVEGHHYAVSLWNLKDAAGDPIPPDDTFLIYRDRIPTDDPAIEARRGHMERVISAVTGGEFPRADSGLYLAWDFTVASERNLSERLLTMRDDAYTALAGEAPPFTITSAEHDDPNSVTEVKGTFTVPSFTVGTGPDLRLNYGSDGLPEQNGTYDAAFGCVIPDAATPEDPARMSLWQHGLLGTFQSAIDDTDDFANAANTVFCGVSWIGMATEDLPTVAAILSDISNFAALPDRAQQGILDTQLLAYLMKHADGLASDANFQEGGAPIIDTSEVVFIGGSQGGIMGGAATATSKEWERAFLAVPGMNFSFLLHRSIYWAQLVEPTLNYSDRLEQTIGLGLIQMLWDRAESNGYAQHLVDDPYEGTPEHDVLLFEAFGDHQVANMATETMARTLGVPMRVPALTPGRSNLGSPFYGIPAIPSFPYHGSALVVWDWGEPPDFDTPAPPLTNIAPTTGQDPHARARSEPLVLLLGTTFLETGEVIDVCGGNPCVSP